MGVIAPLPKMRVIPWPEMRERMLLARDPTLGRKGTPATPPVLAAEFDDDGDAWRLGMPLPRENYAE